MKILSLVICLVGIVACDELINEDRQGKHLNPKFWDQLTTGLDRLGEQVFSSFDSVFGGSDEAVVRVPSLSRSPTPQGGPLRDRPSIFNPLEFGGSGVSPFFNLFETVRSRNWWEGPNVCIERSETDEFLNKTIPVIESIGAARDSEFESIRVQLTGDAVDLDGSEEAKETGDRESRQFQSHVRMSSCEETDASYVCTTKVRSNGVRKTFKTKYSCCFGSVRSPGTSGCTPVEVKSLSETLVSSGALSFLALMQESKALERMAKKNSTFFVPLDVTASPVAVAANDVLSDMMEKPFKNTNADESENDIFRRKRDLKTDMSTSLMSHIVSGVYMAADFKDEMLLNTENPDSKVRVNIYQTPERVVTANCIRITKSDQFTSEGVVHIINGTMEPATRTLADILKNDPKFSIFYQAVSKSGVLDLLEKPGQLTLFAPTNEALEKLSDAELKHLVDGNSCLESTIRHHILPHVICSTAVQARARTRTIASSHVLLERKAGQLTVEGNKILSVDGMGTNGIIHAIDGLLVPENAKNLVQVLESRNFTEFLSLLDMAVDRAGTKISLKRSLNMMTNFTFFVPTNAAVRKFLDDESNKEIINSDKLYNLLEHHLVNTEMSSLKMRNNQVYRTGETSGLRVNTYTNAQTLFGSPASARTTVQCSPIIRSDIPVCGGVLHVVDSVLMPPKETVMDVIRSNSSFSIFTKLLEGSSLVESLSKPSATFTLLAPTDQAFYHLPEETLSEMLKNPEKSIAILKQHVLPEYLCCAGVQRGGFLLPSRRQTLDGASISMQRSFDNQITFGEAQVLKCDMTAGNGVVHMINQVIMPQATRIGPFPLFGNNRRVGFPGLELVLFG